MFNTCSLNSAMLDLTCVLAASGMDRKWVNGIRFLMPATSSKILLYAETTPLLSIPVITVTTINIRYNLRREFDRAFQQIEAGCII